MGVAWISHLEVAVFLLCSVAVTGITATAQSERQHTDIVLIGSTGDLAKKYLWQGLFNLFYKKKSDIHTFKVYAGGLSPPETAEPILSDILAEKINCSDTWSEVKCKEMKSDFEHAVSYVMLKTEDKYKQLNMDLRAGRETIAGQILFYLSIPSKAYINTAKHIHSHCRPADEKTKVRIILEKPFGRDKESAHQMGIELSDTFSEEEIYRVDHYLGKSTVREILPFRSLNQQFEKLLNGDHVERVEIFMKETIGVKGRFDFYDDTGIVRDVFQNHLMELLVLVAMDVPADITSSDDVKAAKLKLLKQANPAKKATTLLGQYREYVSEAEKEVKNVSQSKYTPTFAASVVTLRSPRWSGVPFLLLSGKKLNERSSFVRIIFKKNIVCVSKCYLGEQSDTEQIIFHIGHGELKTPAILVSRSLGVPSWPPMVKEVSDLKSVDKVHGQDITKFKIGVPQNDFDAYTVLIEDLFNGLRDKFVGTEHLSALWDVWNDVLKTHSELPRVYEPKDERGTLNFIIKESRLKFLLEGDTAGTTDDFKGGETDFEEESYTPSTFLGNKLITSTKDELAGILAKDIAQTVTLMLKKAPSVHIAFSGGTSPSVLLEYIAQSFPDLPWSYIHIWQVDERCVPPSDYRSNMKLLQTKLLEFVPIPFENIHPMLVDIAGKLCSEIDNAPRLYQDSIEFHIPNFRFDYIVLGVGKDGHTASLFPGSDSLDQKTHVMFSHIRGKDTDKRMTMTLHLINKAKNIAVLITGKEKHDIVHKLHDSDNEIEDYPILKVKLVSGALTWYIDNEAMDE